jgi:hypothetical protein
MGGLGSIDQLVIVSADKKCGGVTHENGISLQECVIKAVNKWIKTSEAGKQCFAYAGDDLNIGDLSSCVDDLDLIECLQDEGVAHLTIESPELCGWMYDTPLTTLTGDIVDGEYVEDL